MSRGSRAGALLLAAAAGLCACSQGPAQRVADPRPTGSTTPASTTPASTTPASTTPASTAPTPTATLPASPSTVAAPPAPVVPAVPAALPCPPSYAAPDPQRPVLSAALTVDGGTVTGTSRLVFTPDLPTGELVFRLWAAAPRPRARGGGIDVTRVVVDGVQRRTVRSTPTLLRVPLAGRTAPGRPVTIELAWRLRLPTGADDRLGVRGQTAWFGSGLPLLAWARGRGWATDPETANFAEATTSEVMELRSLSVTRPRGLAVLATGTPVSDDGRTAVFRARAVRDLLVATGPFRTATATADGKQVLVGVAPGLPDEPSAVAAEMARALRVHAARFGVFPYERLVVAVVPDLRGGVEHPAGVLLGKGQAQGDATGSHEVAHEWWYGLVGANQAQDPWLDEAFATYAEGLDRGTAARYSRLPVPVDGRRRVGAPMTYWESRRSYFRSVYVQGAAMLLEARATVGAAAFDEAIRCHVRRHAHALTTTADLEASLRHLPAAVAVLRRYGALP
jgi:hypothetical protein